MTSGGARCIGGYVRGAHHGHAVRSLPRAIVIERWNDMISIQSSNASGGQHLRATDWATLAQGTTRARQTERVQLIEFIEGLADHMSVRACTESTWTDTHLPPSALPGARYSVADVAAVQTAAGGGSTTAGVTLHRPRSAPCTGGAAPQTSIRCAARTLLAGAGRTGKRPRRMDAAGGETRLGLAGVRCKMSTAGCSVGLGLAARRCARSLDAVGRGHRASR